MSEKKGGEDDGFLMVVIIVAFLALLCWVIWSLFKFQLIQFVLWVRYAELSSLALIFGNDHGIAVPSFVDKMKLGDWRQFTANADPKEVSFDHIAVTTWMAMKYWKYIFFTILLGMIIWCIFKGPTSLFRRSLGLEGLIMEQAKVFRSFIPFIQFDPRESPFRAPGTPVPAELPLFSEALGPEEWIAFTKNPMPDGHLCLEAANHSFARQLGPRWQGALKQPDYLQVLIASFCLKAARKREQSDDMLGRLASCWHHEKGMRLSLDRGLLKEAKKILRDKKTSEATLKKLNKHAFTNTAILRAIDVARSEGGVMAPAQFVWLRGHNRNLWYPLNNLGRQAYHMEAMGAMSHYRAEKQVDRPILKPRMHDAVTGLLNYMNDPLLVRPIPQLDYSMVKTKGNKNKGIMKPV